MLPQSLIDFLLHKAHQYNHVDFIDTDPISIPHQYANAKDQEISGLFAALFAWGHRTIIIKKTKELLERMDQSPYQFITQHTAKDLQQIEGFVHRTFNDTDILFLIEFLHHHYQQFNSLEQAFSQFLQPTDTNVAAALNGFKRYVFQGEYPQRTTKHIAAPFQKSTCKRLNMFLRWMVRKDNAGVDFGLWQHISPKQLVMPLDVHVIRVAQRFDLLPKAAVSWQTAIDLTAQCKLISPNDPVLLDFALFGLGVIEKY